MGLFGQHVKVCFKYNVFKPYLFFFFLLLFLVSFRYEKKKKK